MFEIVWGLGKVQHLLGKNKPHLLLVCVAEMHQNSMLQAACCAFCFQRKCFQDLKQQQCWSCNGPPSQIRQKELRNRGESISYENKSNHCCLVTASCLSSLRTMGRIRSHLSSNCRDPLFWRRDMGTVEWEEEEDEKQQWEGTCWGEKAREEKSGMQRYTKTYIQNKVRPRPGLK